MTEESQRSVERGPRPTQVTYAGRFLIASIVTGIAESMLHIANAANAPDATEFGGIAKSIANAVVVGLSILVTVGIFNGRKWAYVLIGLCAVALAFSFVESVQGLGAALEFPLQEMYFGGASDALLATAVAFLLPPVSRHWFFKAEP